MKRKIKVLKQIAVNLNNYNINWGVGASMMMYLKGIDIEVNDIDIIIDINDLPKFLNIIDNYSYKKEKESLKYPTDHFYELVIDNVDLDVMFNFKVNTINGIYEYPFKKEKLESLVVDDAKIYLLSTHEWLKAYKAIGRTDKVKILEEYLNR